MIEFLKNVLVEPLIAIYSAVFSAIIDIVNDAGWSVVVFSVVLNLALLPIYYQMERAGKKGLDSRKSMDMDIARIKKHYKGRERYYYIRTIHRQYGYRPISVVFSSSDLYLQIIIFATVFRFLAEQPFLIGSSFYCIRDLSKADGLLWGVNLLPVIMTLFNITSAVVYSKEKSQRRMAFGLAFLFLLFLYGSPSGLVLYWTSNNAFSLLRNYVEKKLVPLLPDNLRQTLNSVANQE